MQKFVTQQSTNIPIGSVIGLVPRQAADRLHMLKELSQEGLDLPVGVTVYETTAKMGFKAGEVIYAAQGLEKNVVSLLIDAEKLGKAVGGDNPKSSGKSKSSDKSISLKDMDRDQLKAYLTEKKVEFNGRSSTKNLLKLALESE